MKPIPTQQDQFALLAEPALSTTPHPAHLPNGFAEWLSQRVLSAAPPEVKSPTTKLSSLARAARNSR